MDVDKRPFYQARLSVEEEDCWRPAVDEWDACYCSSLITPRTGEALRISFGDAVIIFNRNTHKNEVAIVYNISCRPGFFDVVIFRNGAAWKTMVSSGFVLRNTGPVSGPARETFASWLSTTNALQREILQIGWGRMTGEQRDAVRFAAIAQLLVEQRAMTQAAAADRAREILSAWHSHSPMGPTAADSPLQPAGAAGRRAPSLSLVPRSAPGSNRPSPRQADALMPAADVDEDYTDPQQSSATAPPPARRRRGTGVRPPPRKVLRSLLDRVVPGSAAAAVAAVQQAPSSGGFSLMYTPPFAGVLGPSGAVVAPGSAAAVASGAAVCMMPSAPAAEFDVSGLQSLSASAVGSPEEGDAAAPAAPDEVVDQQQAATLRRAPQGLRAILNMDEQEPQSSASAAAGQPQQQSQGDSSAAGGQQQQQTYASTPLGPLVAAASELTSEDGSAPADMAGVVAGAAGSADAGLPEFEMDQALRGVAGAWDRLRTELAVLRSRYDRAEAENVRLRAERDAAVIALQRTQVALAHLAPSTGAS